MVAFLTNIEMINYPYGITFNYNAETLPEKRSINIGNIILFALIGYLFYRYKTGGFNFDSQGLNDILGTKKFQPIKPENIKTYFKDVAGMHEAKM